MLVNGQVNITTWQGDLAHTGLNSQETILTPTNVSASGSFGLLFTHALDGECFAQPLYASGVTLPNGSVHNMVFVTTEADGIYAFDADSASGTNSSPLWYDSLLPAGTTPVPYSDTQSGDIQPELGITSTPVIDLSTDTIYTVSKVKTTSNSTYQQYLHALDLRTGAEKFGGPMLISTTFDGVGSPYDKTVKGVYPFYPLNYHERAALVLYDGIVYLSYASHSDAQPYHGAILAFNASTLALVKQFNTTPNNTEGGIWQGGAGPAIDSAGNMYFGTGNGGFDQTESSYTSDTDWGESFLKLPTSGPFDVSFSNPLNFFTPSNWNSLNQGDLDLGSSGVLLLPDQTGGSHVHLLVGGGKGGTLYVIDRDDMGGYNESADNSVQEIAGTASLFCTPAYFNGSIYYAPSGGPMTQRAVGYNATTGTYISTTAYTTTPTFNNKGAGAFISANGTTNGILWTTNPSNALQAYNAANISGNPIYSFTTQLPGTSSNLSVPKFSLPSEANGKVYFTAFDSNNLGHLFVMGLLTAATTAPAAPSNLVATASSSSQVTLTWTDNSNNESGFKVFRATSAAGPFTQIGLTGANITTYSDSGLTAQTPYYYEVSATNNIGDSALITANATTFSPYDPTGLVAYWNFDEGSGLTANDVTGNGHTGTLNGEIGWISGYIGNAALSFHGTGNAISNVTVPNAESLQFGLTDSFTLSAWVNPAALRSTDEAIVAKSRDQGNYYGIWINSSNQWVFRGPGGDLVGPTATAGTWTHVAVVQDGSAGTRKIYINGVLAASGDAQAADGAGDLWIGQAKSVTNPFPGDIDEVRLYNVALTPAQITTLLGPPVLQALSRQTTGGNANLDLVFPTNGTVPIEPRQASTPGNYSLVLTFSSPVSGLAGSLQLQTGQTGTAVGSVSSITYDATGKIVTVALTGVGNVQRLNLHLTNVQVPNGTTDVPMNLLIGDTNGDGFVTSADLTAVSAAYHTSVGQANYNVRADTNSDGAVSSADLTPIQQNYRTSLP